MRQITRRYFIMRKKTNSAKVVTVLEIVVQILKICLLTVQLLRWYYPSAWFAVRRDFSQRLGFFIEKLGVDFKQTLCLNTVCTGEFPVFRIKQPPGVAAPITGAFSLHSNQKRKKIQPKKKRTGAALKSSSLAHQKSPWGRLLKGVLNMFLSDFIVLFLKEIVL